MYAPTKIIDATRVDKDFLTNTSTTPENNFLFICDQCYTGVAHFDFYVNSTSVTGFSEAKKFLSSSEEQPDLIIIDLPLNHVELVEFKVWLTLRQLNTIPLIYNEAALRKEQINKLFIQKLVDDVVHLGDNYKRLPYKAKFINKLNNGNHTKRALPLDDRLNGKTIVLRSLDIFVSLAAIAFLLPLFIGVAIAVKISSKGPIFYSSLRAGRGFKIFKFYKFRTMIVDADKKINELAQLNLYAATEKNANFFKIKDDPRITKLGEFLRNTSLDELPQLVNVLKGDMSIVGNRPLPLYEAATLTTDAWAERFMAPAGITGLWQISKRGKAEMSNEERIFLDIDYARNHSLRGDLKILIQTPAALFQKTSV